MNKLQRVVCKVFGIEQSVEVVQNVINSASNCDNRILNTSKDDALSIIPTITNILGNSRDCDSFSLGISNEIQSIRSVKLQSSAKRKLCKTTIVIEITETEWD